MSARWLALLFLLPWAASTSAGVTVLDFDGSLPIGAELTRASPALDGRGAVVPADMPRFQVGAVTAGATLVRALPLSDSVIGAAQVGGVQYHFVRLGPTPALTTGEPGADPPPAYVFPDASVVGNFGYPGAVWGFPYAVEVFPDGVVVLHTVGSGPEFRQMTLRTTLASFSQPGGFAVVRVSVYQPPAADVATLVGAQGPRRPVFLPHLGVWASTVSEYTQTGLVSSVYPGAGRALGYASIDEGLTWQRVIDSDLDVPDRTLHPVAKHMHHLEPFEWYDPSAAAWKIGVIAVLGDTPHQGQVIARARGATLPDLPAESYASVARWKVDGVDQLTDLFPLNSSGTPSGGPAFLAGTDGTQAGITTMTLNGDAETDATVFRPTVTLARKPFVLQLNRLGTGAIVAGTSVFVDNATYFAEGFWTSDPQGRYWATAYHAHHLGFRGVLPVGQNRFWTLAGRDDGAYYESALFELPGPPSIRSSLRLEPSTTDVPVAAAFSARAVSVTAESGVEPPAGVGAQRPILRVRSESLPKGQRFDSLVPQDLTAAGGQSVQLSFWVKSLRADLGVASFKTRLDLFLPSGATRSSDSVPVKLDLNGWTPIVLTVRAPAAGVARAAAVFSVDDDASPSRPLDYYFTEPQFVVSDQATIATVRRAATTAGDQLAVHLPPLQSDWSIAVWATEAPTFVLSLLGADGVQAIVQQSKIPSPVTSSAAGSTFDFSYTVTPWLPTLIGSAAQRNVVVPTQDLVVLTQSQGRLTLHVARGMGPVETLDTNAAAGFSPTELRFGTPEWERLFEGNVHRVKVWDDVALDLAGVEAERVSIPPPVPRPPPPGCGIGPELALLLPALLGLRRRARLR